MSERRPFYRQQPRGWWAHKPYLGYMLRELTGVGVALYGAILFAGLISLWRGPQAFDTYRQILASPESLLLHLVLLVVMLWHVVTWFQTMPKTMPRLIANGRHVPQQRLTVLGVVLALGCSALMVAAAAVAGALS